MLQNWTLQEQYALFLQPHVSVNGSKQYRRLFENAVSSCIDVFQDDTELDLIRDQLAFLQPNIFQECCDAVQCDPSELNVLTHGDLWSNNIMFDASDNVDRLLFVRFYNLIIPPEQTLFLSFLARFSNVLLGIADFGRGLFAVHFIGSCCHCKGLGCSNRVLF